MPRPTIHDVADAARVSVATVDRVLNARGGVAEKSVRRVQEAVEALGYVRDMSAANLSRSREYRFVFVLPDSASGFVALLQRAIEAERLRLKGEKLRIDTAITRAFNVEDQVAALQRLSGGDTDGVALMAAEDPAVQREVARLTEAGVAVVTLVADLPRATRQAYVGPDNVVAGRTAASFMGRFVQARSGAILTIAGSLAARDHMERVMGFRMVMEDRFAHLTLLPAEQGFDDASQVQAIIARAMADHDVQGIYAVGAGHRGLIDAMPLTGPKPVAIAHELTDISRAGLQSGALDLVIDQNPAAEVRAALDLMRDLTDKRPVAPDRGAIPLNIFVQENI